MEDNVFWINMSEFCVKDEVFVKKDGIVSLKVVVKNDKNVLVVFFIVFQYGIFILVIVDWQYCILYFIEQIFYYFLVSVFVVFCLEKGIIVCGFDQIIVKFIGIFVKVFFGEYNFGIFIMLEKCGGEIY